MALPPRPTPAILSPTVDLLAVGGLSILVLAPLLLSRRADLDFVGVGFLAWLQALLNYSHFMASYRIVYRDREMIRRHRWAAIGVPLILAGFLGLALLEAQGDSRLLLTAFFTVASGYLAWHYTGQVWGMMASFAHLEGAAFSRSERRQIRSGLRILLAWHVVWFLKTALRDAIAIEALYSLVSAATVLAFGLGALGLWKFRLRAGGPPPLRVVVPWVALFLWYAALARWGLPALFLVQTFHALQYLEFPARVELNRATGKATGRTAAHMTLYMCALLLVSLLVVLIVPGPAMSVVGNLLGASPGNVTPILILYFINIHHYFTDGVIWKISNPEVRQELFAHVAVPVAAAPEKSSSASRRKKSRG
jgi:hypothetical protein